MSVTTENSAGASAIRPFTIKIPEAEIKALRARIAVTRWPEKETVTDDSQGVPLATMRSSLVTGGQSTTGARVRRN